MCAKATSAFLCVTFPATTAMTAIQNTQVNTRLRRYLVHGDSLRWVARSRPPKNVCVQNLWYAAQCSLIRKWIWRSASRQNRMNTHEPLLSSVRIASLMPISGLFAIADQTRIHQSSARRSRNFSRSQRGMGFLVRRSLAPGWSPGAGSPSGGFARASRTRGS